MLEQLPAANARAPKGSTVTLTVAGAVKPVDVPDVTGLGRLAATHALEQAGFRVTEVSEPVGRRSADRRVLLQDPAASSQAKKGDTVTITVGSYDSTLDDGPTSTTTPGTETTG